MKTYTVHVYLKTGAVITLTDVKTFIVTYTYGDGNNLRATKLVWDMGANSTKNPVYIEPAQVAAVIEEGRL